MGLNWKKPTNINTKKYSLFEHSLFELFGKGLDKIIFCTTLFDVDVWRYLGL